MALPTLAGFQSFVTNVMAVPATAVNINGTDVATAYQIAYDTVNTDLAILTDSATTYDLYSLAVYNLAASNLINYAQDIPGSPTSADGLTYFAEIRSQLGLNSFRAGVINATSDVSTSTSLSVPAALENLSIGDLQLIKDPYGRRYLAIAQKYGSSLWGIS